MGFNKKPHHSWDMTGYGVQVWVQSDKKQEKVIGVMRGYKLEGSSLRIFLFGYQYPVIIDNIHEDDWDVHRSEYADGMGV